MNNPWDNRITQDFMTDPSFVELMDAGKRIADEYGMHRLADPIGNIGQVFAVRLSDGMPEPSHTLYPSRGEAERAIGRHDDEDRWMFVQIVPSTLPPRDAAIMLRGNRKLHDRGIRNRTMGGRVMIPRTAREDQIAQLRSIFRGTPPTNVRGG